MLQIKAQVLASYRSEERKDTVDLDDEGERLEAAMKSNTFDWDKYHNVTSAAILNTYETFGFVPFVDFLDCFPRLNKQWDAVRKFKVS